MRAPECFWPRLIRRNSTRSSNPSSTDRSKSRRRWWKRCPGRNTSCASTRRWTPSRVSCLTDEILFRYRADILARLWAHGVQPTGRTPPTLVRNYVRDLYKYEIRRLRERYLQREFPKAEYWTRVDALRRSYPVLALPARLWVESARLEDSMHEEDDD